ncbi:MAG: tRNA (guanosine(46)-N7)-methyltransferase TrmB [Prevotellaceae bacterium]|nr:tRNA (guanosine(46)-N7)-methyltransferase TrmB [Prevotellaceae bacterium]
MGKDKYKRFLENQTFTLLHQPAFEEVFNKDFHLKGHWHSRFFNNANPIVLELGCGKGEYTVAMARMFPDKNFIGIDIKGARMWRGAKTATEEQLPNVAFVRTRIEFIRSIFGENEISEIWITFPDPQMKSNRRKKRLTAAGFLNNYRTFLQPNGIVHLKTDSQFLHEFTKRIIAENKFIRLECCNDIYGTSYANELLSIKTAYEKEFLSQGLPITYLKFNIHGTESVKDPESFDPDIFRTSL